VLEYVAKESQALEASARAYDYSSINQLLLGSMLAIEVGVPEAADEALQRVRQLIEGRHASHVERLLSTIECALPTSQGGRDARACLAARIDGSEYVIARYLLMETEAKAGNLDAARDQARWLVEHRGRAMVELPKFETQIYNVVALNRAELRLIEWLRDDAEPERALRIGALSRSWQQAPPESPWLRELRRLEAESP
jgi:hypothetical protein